MKKQPGKIELSIIILTFNNETDLPVCLNSIYESGFLKNWEVIVIDNNSEDKTVSNLKDNLKKYENLTIIENKENLGFGPANNLAAKKANGDYVLFLNPDTKLEKDAIGGPLNYLKEHIGVGAVSAKLVLGNGKIDLTCHRGEPTPWNSFCYFSGLSKLFPKSATFSGYYLGNLDLTKESEVESINGAYFMLPKEVGTKLSWFDEDFYWKGEDLDLSYRIKELGLKIVYLPEFVVHHYKGSSKGHKRGSKTLESRFEVMRLFYDKHYKNKYPSWMRNFVLAGIKARYLLAYITGK